MIPWREILEKMRGRKTPSWALPTCPQCRISMKENGKAYRCPRCQLTYIPGAGKDGELPNQDDHHGEL